MPLPDTLLTPTIIKYCNRCTKNERSAIVAYCCHLAFSDKSLRRREVEFVEAIANQMEVPIHELRKMARKARRRRLKIKTPASSGARNLLFHLAMRTAISDTRTDAREQSALEHLAHQLRIPPEVAERELHKLQDKFIRPPETPSQPAPLECNARTENYATGIIESLTQNMVIETLIAKLTCPELSSAAQEVAELIYTITSKGEIELEFDGGGLHLPACEKYSVFISDTHICELTSPLNQHTQPIKISRKNCPQQFTIGDSVVLRCKEITLLSGTLQPNG